MAPSAFLPRVMDHGPLVAPPTTNAAHLQKRQDAVLWQQICSAIIGDHLIYRQNKEAKEGKDGEMFLLSRLGSGCYSFVFVSYISF